MENYECIKIFPFEKEKVSSLCPSKAETLENLLCVYESESQDNLRLLPPFAPAIFEKAVGMAKG